jgi:hypothetical protein
MQNKMQITCGTVQIQDVRDDTWGKPSKLVSCVHAIHPFRRRCQPSQGGRERTPQHTTAQLSTHPLKNTKTHKTSNQSPLFKHKHSVYYATITQQIHLRMLRYNKSIPREAKIAREIGETRETSSKKISGQ